MPARPAGSCCQPIAASSGLHQAAAAVSFTVDRVWLTSMVEYTGCVGIDIA